MWRTIGVSVALPTKPVCQDAHCWRILDGDTLLMTVADGAGTAPRAEVGADISSRAALEYLVARITTTGLPCREQDWRALVQNAIAAAIEALLTEAAEQSAPFHHYSTTLIVTVVIPGLVVVGQVGDGMVFVADSRGEIANLTTPERGEYVNETDMLTSTNALDRVQTVIWSEPVTAVAAMTDGLLPITTSLPFYKPFRPFFTNLFAYLSKTEDTEEASAKLKSFLLSDRVQAGTGDDLTLVLAVAANAVAP